MSKKTFRYYKSRHEFEQFHSGLKNTACPHCRTVGNLILHGFLKGFSDNPCIESNKKIKRGHRVFCSNRGRRKGCGRTFSVLCSRFIENLFITAGNLWRFIKRVVRTDNIRQSFLAIKSTLSISTAYYLWKRFISNQSRIRIRLKSLCNLPPDCRSGSTPPAETVSHLLFCFKHHPCPISAFQEQFQTAFM